VDPFEGLAESDSLTQYIAKIESVGTVFSSSLALGIRTARDISKREAEETARITEETSDREQLAFEQAGNFADEYRRALGNLNLSRSEQIEQANRARRAEHLHIVELENGGKITGDQADELEELSIRHKNEAIAAIEATEAIKRRREEEELLQAVLDRRNRAQGAVDIQSDLAFQEIAARRALGDTVALQTEEIDRQTAAYETWISRQLEAGDLTFDEARGLREQTLAVAELRKEYVGLQADLDKYAEVIQGVEAGIGGIAGAFARAATSSENFGDLARGALLRVLEQIIATRAEAVLLQLAFNIFGAVSGGSGGGGLASSLGSAGGAGGGAAGIGGASAVGASFAGAAFGAQSISPSGRAAAPAARAELAGGGQQGGRSVTIGAINLNLKGVTSDSGFRQALPQAARDLRASLQEV
jgi:hypothetical protein